MVEGACCSSRGRKYSSQHPRQWFPHSLDLETQLNMPFFFRLGNRDTDFKNLSFGGWRDGPISKYLLCMRKT